MLDRAENEGFCLELMECGEELGRMVCREGCGDGGFGFGFGDGWGDESVLVVGNVMGRRGWGGFGWWFIGKGKIVCRGGNVLIERIVRV